MADGLPDTRYQGVPSVTPEEKKHKKYQRVLAWEKANPEKVKANQKRCYEKRKKASKDRIAIAIAQVEATLKKMDQG